MGHSEVHTCTRHVVLLMYGGNTMCTHRHAVNRIYWLLAHSLVTLSPGLIAFSPSFPPVIPRPRVGFFFRVTSY